MDATRRGWAIGAVAFVAIAIAAWVTLSKTEALHASSEYAQHSEHVQLALERSLSLLKDAEAGTRGYIVTRNEVMLVPYFDAMKRLDSELRQLTTLVADDAERLAEARELQRLMTARLEPLQSGLEEARSGGPERTRDEIVTAQLEGNRRMNAVRAQVRLMQQKEESVLASQLAAVSSARAHALLAAGGTALLAVALVLLVAFLNSRAAARIQQDASAQRAAALALASSEERLRLAIDGAELGTWDFDFGADQLVWNSHLYRIAGFPPNAPVTVADVQARIPPDDRENVQRAMERSLAEHKPYAIEHRINRADDGAERWVSLLGRHIFDDEGRPVRMIGIVSDITERKRLEQRVRQSQKLDALGTLAGGIAHDFNNILSILRGNLLLIEADLPADHPIAPAIAEMGRACARARDLVRQILAFGRQQEQDRQLVSLADVVPEALRLLRSTIPTAIEIRSRITAGLPTVLADTSQIHQIVMNLGINAAQAIGRGTGIITVDLDDTHVDASVAAHSPDLHEGHYVRLRFGDSGSGMTREVLEHIFEPFFTTKPLGSGTGLGLAVVRGIIKSHDGAVTVYSEPGKGTHFHLYFPVVAGTASLPALAPPPPRKGNGQHILYLDDEEALVLLARRLLERLGYQVSGFSSAAEALAAFEAAPDQYDLVLSDLSMPGITGMDVARRVLEVRPEMPVLLASGYVRTEDVELARNLGVREVIWKPTTINEMGELLGRILAKIIPRG